MHPLTPDLSDLTIDELQSKYNDLVKRMMQVQRSGPQGAMGQLAMFLDDYKTEISIRQQKMFDEISKDNKNFKNIIDIK